MIKTNKILRLFSVLAVVTLVSSCVNDDDYNTPDVTITDPGITANATFQNLVSRYLQAVSDGDNIAIIESDEAPLIVEGYVVSSDKAGNFFEELIIQNKVDGSTDIADPRLGLKVEVNVASLSDIYEFGRKVYIKMNGLAIGESNGVYTIGKPEGDEVDQIQAFEYRDFIIRDPEVANLTPKVAAVSDLTEADENTLIQLDNMQINRNETSLSFAGEPSDEFDGMRTLESCDGGGTITLQTSTFADFKSLQLPQLSGSVVGVYTRDFFDDLSVLVVNSAADFNFTGERCDPEFLECSGSTSTAVTIFEEDFQSLFNESELDGMGWTNVNVSGGSERFERSSFSGDTYLKISAFGTGESPLEAWLVTPPINLDSTTDEELSFDVSASFETGLILTAFITDDYSGDPTTTEWVFLDVVIPTGDGGFGDFVTLTTNISCLDGDVHVAFKYLGSAGGAETRYHIDDIKVTGM
jgi:hypothetical protein